jgi:ketosteroid isomerase-like protein
MSADPIRAAYEALMTGDVEPLVSLIHPDMEWRGRRRLRRFWQRPPSWRGPHEAREVLRSGIDWRRKAGDHDGRIDSVEQRGSRVVVAFSWMDNTDNRHDWAQVLKLTDGKIIAMQDYAKPSNASIATRVRTALT